MGLDTKTYWLIDRQSQFDFDFDASQLRVNNSAASKEIATGSS
jgi:hypothetical protein